MHLVCVCVRGGGEGGHPNDVLFAQSSLSHTHTLHTHSVPHALSLSLTYHENNQINLSSFKKQQLYKTRNGYPPVSDIHYTYVRLSYPRTRI